MDIGFGLCLASGKAEKLENMEPVFVAEPTVIDPLPKEIEPFIVEVLVE